MAPKIITISVEEDKLAAIDALAEQTERDRAAVLEEAVNTYLSDHQRWKAMIEEGIRQADAGQTVPHKVVVRQLEARIEAKAALRAGRK